MLKTPQTKYHPEPPVQLTDRRWPDRVLTQAPRWMSTDLRDGNQALFEPMDGEHKLAMFRMLCQIGFKDIEVAFPAASQTDFDFVRTLIEGGHIPEDVTIEVLTQARPHLIARTIESLAGCRRAIIHIYNATSPAFRERVFGMVVGGVCYFAHDWPGVVLLLIALGMPLLASWGWWAASREEALSLPSPGSEPGVGAESGPGVVGLDDLCRQVLPVWGDHLGTVRRQAEDAIATLSSQFSTLAQRLNAAVEASRREVEGDETHGGNRR